MINEKTAGSQQAWTPGTNPAWRWQRNETALHRFLGGTPFNVALRLFFVSLVVGALLIWLDIRPADVIAEVTHSIRQIWAMGFGALRELSNYVLAGAVIVVPVWLIMRLLNTKVR